MFSCPMSEDVRENDQYTNFEKKLTNKKQEAPKCFSCEKYVYLLENSICTMQ